MLIIGVSIQWRILSLNCKPMNTQESHDVSSVSQTLATYRLGIKPSAAKRLLDAEDVAAAIETLGDEFGGETNVIELSHVEDVLASTDIAAIQSDTPETDEDSEQTSVSDDDEPADTELDTPPEETTKAVSQQEAAEPSVSARSETAEPAEEPADTETTESGIQYFPHGVFISGDTPAERWPDAWEKTLVSDVPEPSYDRESSDRDVVIHGDITGESRTTGEFSDFQRLFKDRFTRLEHLLAKRMPPTVKLGNIDERLARTSDSVSVIGLVTEARKSKNGHDLIEIEDLSGRFRVLFSKDHTPDPIKEMVDRIVPDEVIGFTGSLSDDAGIMFADELFFPDLPPMRIPKMAARPVEAVLLSDLHFGAVDFAADEWKRFVHWMYSEEARNVEYILIAGDLVEGIGVYPGQEEEMDVIDINDQYALCADALRQLPADVDIYAIMGNHDTVRLAEPQPVIKDDFKTHFAENVHFAGNPATLEVEGVNFLLYHGMSLNPLTDRTPGLDIHEPTGAMKLMLEKRHLAPMYGMNVRLAPEHKDYLVIEDIPEVLHTGHVHTYGLDTYKNVTMTNTGCWQYQTDFQKKLNVVPDVGMATVVNLQTLNAETLSF